MNVLSACLPFPSRAAAAVPAAPGLGWRLGCGAEELENHVKLQTLLAASPMPQESSTPASEGLCPCAFVLEFEVRSPVCGRGTQQDLEIPELSNAVALLGCFGQDGTWRRGEGSLAPSLCCSCGAQKDTVNKAEGTLVQSVSSSCQGKGLTSLGGCFCGAASPSAPCGDSFLDLALPVLPLSAHSDVQGFLCPWRSGARGLVLGAGVCYHTGQCFPAASPMQPLILF